MKLTLEPNHDILPSGAKVEYLDENGEVARTEVIDRSAVKVFRGTTWLLSDEGYWENVGWSRIMLHRDGKVPLFDGAFTIFREQHHIQLRTNYMQTKLDDDPDVESLDDESMVLFRDSDIGTTVEDGFRTEMKRSIDSNTGDLCGSDQLLFNGRPDHSIFRSSSPDILTKEQGFWGSRPVISQFGKRQIDGGTAGNSGNSAGVNLTNSIGVTTGCPNSRRVALVGVATDCTYTGSFTSAEAARANVISQFNLASSLYEKTFNISLGLHTLTVNDANCPTTAPSSALWNYPCSANVSIQDRLNLFAQWRGDRQNDTNAYWTLLSTCNTGTAVGLAWLGQLCVSQTSTSTDGGMVEHVNGANIVVRTSTEWQVIAHETGHTFGAVHDCDPSTCASSNTVNSQQCCPLSQNTCSAGGQFIMNPSTSGGIKEFSPCSIGNICSALGRNSVKSGCLTQNKEIVTITGNECGNGIVETGEDCDCGGTANCGDSPCCDATTCKFKAKAVCDDSNEDCCSNCQFAPSTKVCRASTGPCDLPEMCPGNGANCPPDKTQPDGQACGNGTMAGLTCSSGQCTSRDQQCKTLMGTYTMGNDTYACDANSCVISCASPEFGPNVCYGIQQNFLDGTTCGGGGKCSNGNCAGGSVGGAIGDFVNDHRTLVIGVCSGVGGLLLLASLCCLFSCLRRRKSDRRRKRALLNQGWADQPVYSPPRARRTPAPRSSIPPMENRTYSWNGRTDARHASWLPPNVPAPPPPSANMYPGGSHSVRYA